MLRIRITLNVAIAILVVQGIVWFFLGRGYEAAISEPKPIVVKLELPIAVDPERYQSDLRAGR